VSEHETVLVLNCRVAHAAIKSSGEASRADERDAGYDAFSNLARGAERHRPSLARLLKSKLQKPT
jgi:hypothetical protein